MLRSAVDLAPGDGSARESLGACLLAQGRYAEG